MAHKRGNANQPTYLWYENAVHVHKYRGGFLDNFATEFPKGFNAIV